MNNLPELKHNFGVSLAGNIPQMVIPRADPEMGWLDRKMFKGKMKDFSQIMEHQAKASEDMLRVARANDECVMLMVTFSDRLKERFELMDHERAMRNMAEYMTQTEAKKKAHEAEIAEYEAKTAKLNFEAFERKFREEYGEES